MFAQDGVRGGVCKIKGSVYLLSEVRLRVLCMKGKHSSKSCATHGSNAIGMLLKPLNVTKLKYLPFNAVEVIIATVFWQRTQHAFKKEQQLTRSLEKEH